MQKMASVVTCVFFFTCIPFWILTTVLVCRLDNIHRLKGELCIKELIGLGKLEAGVSTPRPIGLLYEIFLADLLEVRIIHKVSV